MTDKEMIEEMADCDNCIHKDVCYIHESYNDCAEEVKETGCFKYHRKIPEGSVVLSEGEYSDIIEDEVKTLERDIAEYWACSYIDVVAQELHKDGYRKLDDHAIMTLRKAKGLEERTRKETARNIYKLVDNKLDLYRKGVIGGSLYDDGYKSAIYDVKRTIKELFGVEVEE